MTTLDAVECVGVFVGFGGIEVGILDVVGFAGFHDVAPQDHGGYHGEDAGAEDYPAVAVGDCDDRHDYLYIFDEIVRARSEMDLRFETSRVAKKRRFFDE